MQPILAESAPHRRPLVLAAVLAVAASIATLTVAMPRPPHTRWHRHHHPLPYNGQCPYGYVYVAR
jgi:hypothetical protein